MGTCYDSNETNQVWNPIDSPDTADAYLKDTIDNVHIFIIEEKKISIRILIKNTKNQANFAGQKAINILYISFIKINY